MIGQVVFGVVALALSAGGLSFVLLQGPDRALQFEKVVFSFAPTPLYRGAGGAAGFRGDATMYVSHRAANLARQEPATTEVWCDVAALNPQTGELLATDCVRHFFDMRSGIDVKKVRIAVSDVGVEFHWPDGVISRTKLFAAGTAVEVVILALAVRNIGEKEGSVEKVSMIVRPDLDGDGVADERRTQDADWQTGIFTS